jgi:hypothetical protein
LLEIGPRHQLHGQEPYSVLFVETVDRRDSRMIERRQDLGFALEAQSALGISGEARRQDLDRRVAVECLVAGAKDLPHPAFTDLLEDAVLGEGSADQTKSTTSRCTRSARRLIGQSRMQGEGRKRRIPASRAPGEVSMSSSCRL